MTKTEMVRQKDRVIMGMERKLVQTRRQDQERIDELNQKVEQMKQLLAEMQAERDQVVEVENGVLFITDVYGNRRSAGWRNG